MKAVHAALLAVALNFAPLAQACTVRTPSVLIDHGTYDVFRTTDDDANSNLQLRACATSYTVKISTGVSGTYAARTMSSGSDTLSYNLYTEVGRVNIWGDGTGGTTFGSYASHSGNVNRTIYSRIPKLQDVAVGTYTDTLTITIDF